jgi:hypothetical protein
MGKPVLKKFRISPVLQEKPTKGSDTSQYLEE